MSIINDALKKVQQNLERHKRAAAANFSSQKSLPKENFLGPSQTIIIASFIGSILVLVIFFIFSPKQTKSEPPLVAEKNKPTQNDVQQVAAPAAPLPAPFVQEKSSIKKNRVVGLTLNGIVKMDQEYVALINNIIVKEGEAIGDRRILKISKDEVKVFDNGETIILKLSGF